MNKQVDNILNQVTELSKKYINISKMMLNEVSYVSKKYDQISKLTGENFNVFQILKLSTAEVRTHSAFIGELLKPNGCHDQGDVFLQLFLEQLKEKLDDKDFGPIESFDSHQAQAKVEENIGNISEDGTKGGQIDIIVTDNNNKAIIIENKIYAEDQRKQLIRYYNYGMEKHNGKYILLYLTLYGTTASDKSTGRIEEDPDLDPENIENNEEPISKHKVQEIKEIKKKSDINVINLSYRNDIILWLEKCKEKAVNHPYLRETIAQYINLIKYLTNQTINSEMEKEIKKIIAKDKDSLKAAFQIVKTIPELKNELIYKFNDKLKEIAKSLGLNIEGGLTEGKGYEKIWFNKESWKSKICLSFEKRNSFDKFWIGIRKGQNVEKYNKEDEDHKRNIFNILEKGFSNSKNTEKYAWFWYFNITWCPTNWSNNEEVWLNIYNNNESFYEEMEKLLKKLSDVLDDV